MPDLAHWGPGPFTVLSTIKSCPVIDLLSGGQKLLIAVQWEPRLRWEAHYAIISSECLLPKLWYYCWARFWLFCPHASLKTISFESRMLLSHDKWSSCNLAVNEMEVINLKMIGIMIRRCERESSAAYKSPCELNQIDSGQCCHHCLLSISSWWILNRDNLVNIKMNYVLNFDVSDYVMVGFHRTDEVIMHMDSSRPVT